MKITVDTQTSPAGPTFDFDISGSVRQIWVKGGNGANFYTYSPSTMSGMDLHAPYNQNSGSYYGLSHICFCMEKDYGGKRDAIEMPTAEDQATDAANAPMSSSTKLALGVGLGVGVPIVLAAIVAAVVVSRKRSKARFNDSAVYDVEDAAGQGSGFDDSKMLSSVILGSSVNSNTRTNGMYSSIASSTTGMDSSARMDSSTNTTRSGYMDGSATGTSFSRMSTK